MLEIENFVPYDMSLWSNGGSTGANNPDNQSLITFGSAKSSSSLRTYKIGKKLHVILPFSHLIHVHSGHIHVSSAFLSAFKNNR